MPSHRTRYVDVMPQWPYEPQVPVQPELPGVRQVVRTPGQSGIVGDTGGDRSSATQPDGVNGEVAV